MNELKRVEEILLTDHVVTIGSRTFTVTSAEQFVIGLFLLFGLVLVAALIFSRRRVVMLKRSSGTEQLAFELSRIADALERIANRPADRVIEEASRREVPMVAAAAAAADNGTPGRHSMFGF